MLRDAGDGSLACAGRAGMWQEPDGNFLGNRQTQRLCVRQQAVVRKVHVAPHERAGTADHLVEDLGAADVAAMNDMGNTDPVEEGHRQSHGQVTTVAV